MVGDIDGYRMSERGRIRPNVAKFRYVRFGLQAEGHGLDTSIGPKSKVQTSLPDVAGILQPGQFLNSLSLDPLAQFLDVAVGAG